MTRWLGDRLEKTLRSTVESLRENGRAEGRAEMLLRILDRRFGAVAPEVQGRVRSATIPELDRWADAMFEAATLDDVFGTTDAGSR